MIKAKTEYIEFHFFLGNGDTCKVRYCDQWGASLFGNRTIHFEFLIVQEFPFCGGPHGFVAQGRGKWRTVPECRPMTGWMWLAGCDTQNRHPVATTPAKSACKTVIATSLRR